MLAGDWPFSRHLEDPVPAFLTRSLTVTSVGEPNLTALQKTNSSQEHFLLVTFH